MAYPVHWVWLGGALAGAVEDNVRAWLSAGKGFQDDILPILWVDKSAFDRLYEARKIGRHALDLGHGVESIYKLSLPDANPRRVVSVINVETKQGRGWRHNLGVFGQLNTPGWAALGPAVVQEASDANGLKQVASDIVRIAALWLMGGAYWDLGDSAPGKTRFGLAKLRTQLQQHGGSPAMIPQVLPHSGSHRTENGIIFSNPDRADAARAIYAEILDKMRAKYAASARVDEARTQIEAWRDTTRGRLAAQIRRDGDFLGDINNNAPLEQVFRTRVAVLTELRNRLDNVTTATGVDDAVVAALKLHPQNEITLSKLFWATLKENEATYFRQLCDALGGEVDVGNVMQRVSLTVSDYTFDAFVTEAGEQVVAQGLAQKAQSLYQTGWKKLEGFFGGNTKTGSWYSWKTRPGRMLMGDLARVDDVPLAREGFQEQKPTCSLCEQKSGMGNRHHCRRCGIHTCSKCGAKVRHAQPRGSATAKAWDGSLWACLGCISVIDRRR